MQHLRGAVQRDNIIPGFTVDLAHGDGVIVVAAPALQNVKRRLQRGLRHRQISGIAGLGIAYGTVGEIIGRAYYVRCGVSGAGGGGIITTSRSIANYILNTRNRTSNNISIPGSMKFYSTRKQARRKRDSPGLNTKININTQEFNAS